jgi:hypothetical protein
MNNLPEVWLRGPLPEITPLLQPVAHSLLQTNEEIRLYLEKFPDEKLHDKPFGRASVAFHLKHMTGVLDRMVTYSKGLFLSDEQLEYLRLETIPGRETKELLIKAFEEQTFQALNYFKTIDSDILTDFRTVGRKKLPSTVIGLLFHAAEHAQRHAGALQVLQSILLHKP